MLTSTITSDGQITLPKEIREALGVQPGDEVLIWRNDAGQVVVEAKTVDLWSLRGILKGRREGVTIEEMNEGIAQGAIEGCP